jgi:hypothetical protein
MNAVLERPAGVAHGCAVCGSRDRVTMTTYRKIYTPPWVYVLLLAGPIPCAIVSMIVRTVHNLTVPMCVTCGARRKNAGLVSGLSLVAAVVLLLGGIIVGAANGSLTAFLAGLMLAGVVAVWAGKYEKNSQPEYLTLDGSNVVIRDAARGPVVLVAPVWQQPAYQQPAYQQPRPAFNGWETPRY